MSEVNSETRSTIILFIAILIAVVITVWLILSFDRPNDRDNRGRQTGLLFTGHNDHIITLQIEKTIIYNFYRE